MNPEKLKVATEPAGGVSEKLFTAAEANSSLVLVRRIVADLVLNYRRLLELRDMRHSVVNTRGNVEQIETLNSQIESTSAWLNELHAELTNIGCVLKDWSEGLVDFPSMHQGRKVWLCWRLTEPAVAHWHDLHGGFVGRQPVGPDFG